VCKAISITEYGEGSGTNYAVMFRRTDGSPAVKVGEGQGLAVSPDAKLIASVLPSDIHHILLLPTGAGEARSIDIAPLELSTQYEV
jgi:hypothetical protein